VRWYVIPAIEAFPNVYGPAYVRWTWHGQIANSEGVVCVARWKDYGFGTSCLVVADVTTEQHAVLAAHEDVIAVPANIDNYIPAAALPTVEAKLESLAIPGDWVTTSHTYRDVLRMTAHLFLLAQRYNGMTGHHFTEITDQTLDRLVSEIPTQIRQDLNAAAQSLGYDTSMIQGSWTLRRALRELAQQWGDTPVLFGNIGGEPVSL